MMERKKRSQLNNNGSTLVIVLVMIAFISILSMAVTTAAMTNLRMKAMNRESTKTFYTAEDAIDEIYAALGKTSMECFDTAYQEELAKVINNVSAGLTDPNYVCNNELRIEYMDRIGNAFLEKTDSQLMKTINPDGVTTYGYQSTNTEAEGEDADKFILRLQSYLEEGTSIRINNVEKLSITDTDSKAETNTKLRSYSFQFTNCEIEYQNEDGYYSKITFDGSVGMPDSVINFVTEGTEGIDEFIKYSLVGNTGIEVAGKDTRITGNAYAGKGNNLGLTLNTGANLLMEDGTFVTAGDINLSANATLRAENQDIWCTNIRVNDDYATIDVDSYSSAYVNDDLQIDGNDASIRVYGNYIGYGYKKATNINPHENVSAIIMNGKGATLDFSRIRSLVLAGSAYIDFTKKQLPTSYGTTTLGAGNFDAYNTGNSIDYIGAQEIYLVPTILMGNQANPNQSAELTVDLSVDSFFGFSYLDETNPYTVKNIDGMNYYYLNFKSDADTVQNYVKAVFDVGDEFTNLLNEKSDEVQENYRETKVYVANVVQMNLSNIKSGFTGLSNANVHSNGMMIIASKARDGSVTTSLADKDASSFNYIENDSLCSQYYKSLSILLSQNAIPSFADEQQYRNSGVYGVLVDQVVLQEKTGEIGYNPLSSTNGKLVYVVHNGNPGSPAIAVGGDGDVTEGSNEGIIIASGDVIVNKDFKGLIIAGGKITINNNAKISNKMNGTTVESMVGNNQLLQSILKAWDTEDHVNNSEVSMENMTYKDLVRISNWRK